MSQKDVNLPFKFTSDITFTVPSLQRYPTDIFKWIKKNANPRMLIKLMQVCKYFCYQKFPYLVTYSFDGFEEDIFNYSIKSGYINKRMKYPCNKSLWITRVLTLKTFPSILPKFIESMIICDATYIHLERIHVSFSDFKILTASRSVEILHCYGNTMICDDSGNIASLENILECLPKLERLVL
uniref:F-box domain-containing protein n=1 Tax=Panagrolaimus davidi TaxID=227884 RepID=A0A914PJM6_9BILA